MKNESYSAQDINKYYNSISKETLFERFKIFEKIHDTDMQISEIQEFLKNFLLWSNPAYLPIATIKMGSSLAKLYRIRNIDSCTESELSSHKSGQATCYVLPKSASIVNSGNITISLKHLNKAKLFIANELVSEKDFWEPSADKVNIKVGRLNDESESLLYTADGIRTAQLETNIKYGDIFILITYKLKTDQILDLSLIGTELHIKEELSDSTKEKLSMVVRFFTKEATRSVGKDKRFYKVSNAIAKFIREYSDQDTDGWAHTSAHAEIQNINRELQKTHDNLQLTTNFCLFPEKAHEKLEIESVQICVSNEKSYAPVAHLEKYNENGKPIFKWII